MNLEMLEYFIQKLGEPLKANDLIISRGDVEPNSVEILEKKADGRVWEIELSKTGKIKSILEI